VPDRRTKARFEIVGRLPGSLATERRVHLHNVSVSGALIETAAPLQPDTIFSVTFESDKHLATLRARVCHVRRTHLDDGYLVGLEFLGAEPGDGALPRPGHRGPQVSIEGKAQGTENFFGISPRYEDLEWAGLVVTMTGGVLVYGIYSLSDDAAAIVDCVRKLVLRSQSIRATSMQ